MTEMLNDETIELLDKTFREKIESSSPVEPGPNFLQNLIVEAAINEKMTMKSGFAGFGSFQDEYFPQILVNLKSGKYNKLVGYMESGKFKASSVIDGDQLQADVELTGFSIGQFLSWIKQNEDEKDLEFEFIISESNQAAWEERD